MESQWKPVTFQRMLEEGVIKPQKLYESIVIIKWPNQKKFNSAAMGVKFTDLSEIKLSPYPDTDTYDLLMNTEVELMTVNLTDDIKVFAKSALSGLHSGSNVEEIKHSILHIHPSYAYLKKSQYNFLGEIGERGEVTTDKQSDFILKVKEIYKTNVIPQSVNRGDNLALEAIVYASKIPAAKNKEDIIELVDKVKKILFDIRRFSNSKRAFWVCDYIDVFLGSHLREYL